MEVANCLNNLHYYTSYCKAENMIKGKIIEHCLSGVDLCYTGHNHKGLDQWLLAGPSTRFAAIVRELYLVAGIYLSVSTI